MNLKRSYRSLVGGVWAGVLTTCLGLAMVTVWTDTRDYERTIRDARSTATNNHNLMMNHIRATRLAANDSLR